MFVNTVSGSHRGAASSVCELVDQHYYRSGTEKVRGWLTRCRAQANDLPVFITRQETIATINSLLAELEVSHLFLYTPDENRALWDQEARDTGLRARNIDGHYILHEVIAGSAGAKAGFRPGDEIVRVDGYDIASPAEIASTSGRYELVRAGRSVEIEVRAESLALDFSPTLTTLGKGVRYLRIQSLLARHFEKDAWIAMAIEMKTSRHIVLDLRGNAGGSFPAMLRVASAFFCDETRIGTIVQPSEDESGIREASLADELSTDAQLNQLGGVSKMHLRTFSDYPCFDGRATVLVDMDTSSVAEILAESFFDRPRSRVWGMPTAGQVVMAQWFPISGLGAGDFSVSIPIAGYVTRAGVDMEDTGVTPEKLMYYDLKRAREGRDSWLDDVVTGIDGAR